MKLFAFSATIFLVFVVILECKEIAEILTVNIDVRDDYYTNNFTFECVDTSPKKYQTSDFVSSAQFLFNDTHLPDNVHIESVLNPKTGNETLLLVVELPTIANNGFYDCCIKKSTKEGVGVAEYCARNWVRVREYNRFGIPGSGSVVEASLRQNWYFAVFAKSANVTNVDCKLNGLSLPNNTFPMYSNKTGNPYPGHSQLVVLEATRVNLGTYTCGGRTSDNGIRTKVFTVQESPMRKYPWNLTAIPNPTKSSLAKRGANSPLQASHVANKPNAAFLSVLIASTYFVLH